MQLAQRTALPVPLAFTRPEETCRVRRVPLETTVQPAQPHVRTHGSMWGDDVNARVSTPCVVPSLLRAVLSCVNRLGVPRRQHLLPT